MSVLESTIGHVAEALVVAAAQHLEEALIVRAIDRKAQTLARAGQIHAAGLEELALSLLGRVEDMDAQTPLASVIPMVSGAVEMVRVPGSEVVEAAARYLNAAQPGRFPSPRKEREEDLASGKSGASSRRRLR